MTPGKKTASACRLVLKRPAVSSRKTQTAVGPRPLMTRQAVTKRTTVAVSLNHKEAGRARPVTKRATAAAPKHGSVLKRSAAATATTNDAIRSVRTVLKRPCAAVSVIGILPANTQSTSLRQAAKKRRVTTERLHQARPVIVIMGPPASGKSTQCKLLAESTGVVHVGLGDLCREFLAESTGLVHVGLGELCRELIVRGGTSEGLEAQALERSWMMPDDKVIAMITRRLSQLDVQQAGCLLDGFPSTGPQAEALATCVAVDRFIVLEVPEACSIERAFERRIGPETGDIYTLKTVLSPPEVAHRLVKRDSDASEMLTRKRWTFYNSQLNSILPSFKGKIQSVDATKPVVEVLSALTKLMSTPLPLDADYAPLYAAGIAAPMDEEDDWPDDLPLDRAGTIAVPSLSVFLGTPVGAKTDECKIVVSVEIPEGERALVDICCVVDVSGSMNSKAVYEADGVQKDDGFSLLDIAKHASKAVVHMLTDEDRFALVSFASEAYSTIDLGFMTEGGKQAAIAAIEGLHADGKTYMWKGIFVALENLRTRATSEELVRRHRTLLVLTDGRPDEAPATLLKNMKEYKEQYPGFNFQMNIFGFGYELNSDLLLDLAVEGHGTYAFVPDALILGTCFVNCVANVCTTYAQNSTLHLTAKNGAEFSAEFLGGHLVKDASWGKVVSFGPLQFGQQRQLVVPMNLLGNSVDTFLEATLVCRTADGTECQASAHGLRETRTVGIQAVALSDVIGSVGQALLSMDRGNEVEASACVKAMVQRVRKLHKQSCHDRIFAALLKDVQGRMAKAYCSMDRFNRWGKHYLRALARAHQLQMCTNFKDPGLQVYGGTRFKDLRTEGDQLFVTIPMSKPSNISDGVSRIPAWSTSYTPPCSASAYYCSGGG